MSQPSAEHDRSFFGIGRTVFVLGLVSLLQDVSSEMVIPVVLPLFLRKVLRASYEFIGIIEGIADSTASLLKVVSGWLSDRLRARKSLAALGYGVSTVAKPFLYLASLWWHVMIVRFADRVGKGIRSAPRDALIAASADPAVRGRAFGFHRAMDTVGAVCGPLLAWWLLQVFAAGRPERAGLDHASRMIFLIATIPAALAVLLILVAVREKRPTPAAAEKPPPRLSFAGLDRRFISFLFVATLFMVGNSSDAFLVLRATDLGLSARHLLLIYVGFNIVSALGSTPAGMLSDRFGRRPVISIGYLIFAVVYLGFAQASSGAVVWLLFLVYGLYSAATESVQRAFAADLSPPELRGTGLGLYHTLTGVALLPASIIAGVLWKTLGPRAPFYYGAATAALSALLLLLLLRGKDRKAAS